VDGSVVATKMELQGARRTHKSLRTQAIVPYAQHTQPQATSLMASMPAAVPQAMQLAQIMQALLSQHTGGHSADAGGCRTSVITMCNSPGASGGQTSPTAASPSSALTAWTDGAAVAQHGGADGDETSEVKSIEDELADALESKAKKTVADAENKTKAKPKRQSQSKRQSKSQSRRQGRRCQVGAGMSQAPIQ
jgi:hypothetical protein